MILQTIQPALADSAAGSGSESINTSQPTNAVNTVNKENPQPTAAPTPTPKNTGAHKGDISDLLPGLSGHAYPLNNGSHAESTNPSSGNGLSDNSQSHVQVSSRFTPGRDLDVELNSSTRNITLHVPKDAVDEEVNVEIIDHGPQADGMLGIFELHARPQLTLEALRSMDTMNEVKNFKRDLTISIHHDPAELWGLNLDTLKLYCLDEETRKWVPVPDSRFDPETNTLTATISHFSYYGENADPTFMGPGKVMNYQTDLHTGAATYSYPIEVPPGVAGFQPEINLTYNSAGVDEMKNKKDVGSWVGIGWSLGLGSIQQVGLFKFVLTLDGATYYELSQNGSEFVTVPETYYKIQVLGDDSSDGWEVIGTDGTKYQFGGTNDSTQHLGTKEPPDFWDCYRWDLSSITDTHGNTISVEYVQNSSSYGIRAAYPHYVMYNNDNSAVIEFNVSFNRIDVPMSLEPKVIETGRLNSIITKVNGSQVKEYDFTYNTSPCYNSDDYSQRYQYTTQYAGELTLISITEKGSDGTPLPTMNFSYTDLPIACKDSSEIPYEGNPGNVATLSHPYLTEVTNGYGGTVSYTYSEKPQYWHEVNSDSRMGGDSLPILLAAWCSPSGDFFTSTWNFSVPEENGQILRYDGYYFSEMGIDNTQTLWDIWGTQSDDVFTAGEGGTILHYNGSAWKLVHSNASMSLNGIGGTSATDVYAVGTNTDWNEGIILHYNGLSWSPMTSNTSMCLWDVWGSSSQNVYAVGNGGTILHCNGSEWTPVYTNSSFDLTGIWGSSATDIYAAGSNGAVLHYNGSEWTTIDIGASDINLYRVWGSSSDDIFIGSLCEYTFHFNGSAWSLIETGLIDSGVFHICGDLSGDVYAVGIQSGVGFALKYNYSGSSWDALSGSGLPGLTGAWYWGDIYASSMDGAILRYNGYYWTEIDTGNVNMLWDIWGSSPLDIYAVGFGGTVLHYNGSVCTPMYSGTQNDLWGIWGNSSTDVYAVGSGGTILHCNGSEWNTVYTNSSFDLFAVWGNGTDVFAVGTDGTILRSNGSGWNAMTSNTLVVLEGIWGDSSSNIFVVGDYGTILHYNGQSWINMESGASWATFRAVWGTSASDVFVSGSYNYVLHYDGISWSPMSTGIADEWPWLGDICGDYEGNVYIAGVSFNGFLLKFPYSEDIWTREIITSMTVDAGIGPQQKYDYSYTGEPQYFKVGPGTHPWDDQYRGFPQVRVIDSDGNYADHYFWTTGNGDAEILTGREYRTEWYNSSGQLMERKDYTWAYRFDVNEPDPFYYDASPVGYWTLNESEGQTFNDSSGNGYNGTLGPTTENESSDPRWARGRFDSALSFDGKDDYAKLNSSTSLDPTIGFAMAAWVKRDSANTMDCILAAGRAGFNDNAHHQFLWYIDGSGKNSSMVFVMGNGEGEYVNSSVGATAILNGSLSDSRWHEVVVGLAPDPPNGYEIGFLVDNLPVGGATGYYNGDPLNVSITDWRIGSRAGGGDYFHGSIDDVRIYNDWTVFRSYVRPPLGNSPFIYMKEETDTIGSNVSRTRYDYDAHGNLQTVSLDGDITTNEDDRQIWRVYSNSCGTCCDEEESYIFDKLVKEAVVHANVSSWSEIEQNTSIIEKMDWYLYDDCASPYASKGDLTAVYHLKSCNESPGEWITGALYGYDEKGNRITETDGNGNTWTITYNNYLTPKTITSPLNQSESYNFNAGTGNMLRRTDVNGETTYYDYDTLGRLTAVIKPGDNSSDPSIQYDYYDWGNASQHLKTTTKINDSDSLWSSQYFDGLGRVIQTQSQGESGHTIIGSTTTYDSRGLTDKVYVSQDVSSSGNGYETPGQDWRCSSTAYDGLGRAINVTAADGTSTTTNYSVPWQQTVTNPLGHKHVYHYDAFGQLVSVDELDDSHALYATTEYNYDDLGNLVRVQDANGSVTSMTYDLLGRKTAMSDPDMGNWSYHYDNCNNLISQTDANTHTITMTYDNLSRPTAKLYPVDSGMTNVSYTYDDTSGGNYGKGRLTGMTDVMGDTTYQYDARGRLTTEYRFSTFYTYYDYDTANRLTAVTYPTGEVVTQTYNGRGLPNTLSSNVSGNLVTGTTYNELGQITRIDYGNGDHDTYAYYGLDGEAPSGYWGSLWRIQTCNSSTTLNDIRYTWDANGNMLQRQDYLANENESFSYDFLDRLISVSGVYSATYTYDEIGNIMSMNGVSYTYGSQPHAATSVGNTSYEYDANGNMITRGNQTITWDYANMPISVTDGGNTSQFVYDGNGNRIVKYDGGELVIYVNKYYEWNDTTGEATSHYYLGGKEVAYKVDTDLRYVHQDSLGSTSLTTSSTGAVVALVSYFPFGVCRNSQGTLDTDKLFTGQRLDDTGLYYYNARYYDATIGRFISPDTIVPNYKNPQALNRYSYCNNNPLKYIDPTGHNGFTDWWSDRWHDLTDAASDWWNLQKANWNLVVHHDEQSWNAYKEASVRLILPAKTEADLEKGGTYTVGLQGSASCPLYGAFGGWEYSFSLKGGFQDRWDTWSYTGSVRMTDFQLSAGPYIKVSNAENVQQLDPDKEIVRVVGVTVPFWKIAGPGCSIAQSNGPGYQATWLGLSLDIGFLPVSGGTYPGSWFGSATQPNMGSTSHGTDPNTVNVGVHFDPNIPGGF